MKKRLTKGVAFMNTAEFIHSLFIPLNFRIQAVTFGVYIF